MIDLFGLPLTSIALFLLAGILIGHLLWHRDRSDDTKKMSGLEDRYVQARGSARQRKSDFRKLQKTNQSQQAELEQLRQAHETLQSKSIRLEQASQESRAELSQLRLAKNDTEKELEAEQKRSQTVIAQMQELLTTKTALELETASQADTIVQLRETHENLENQIGELQSTIETASTESNEDAKRQQQSILHWKDQANAFQASLNQSDKTLKQTQQDLVDRCADLDAVRSERDELDRELARSKQHAMQLDAELSFAKSVATERDEIATDLEAAASSLAEQRQLLESRESDLASANEKIVQLENEIRLHQNKIQEHGSTNQQLSDSLASARSRATQLESELATATEKSDELQTQNRLLTESINADKSTIGQLQQDRAAALAHVDRYQTNLDEQSSLLASKEDRITEMRRQIEDLLPLRSELTTISLELAEYKNKSQRSLDTINRHRLELESSRETLESMARTIDSQHTQVRDLTEQVAVIETLRDELSLAGETIQAYHERGSELESLHLQQVEAIETLRDELSRASETIQAYHDRGSALESLHVQQISEIMQLREESAKVPGLLLESKKQIRESDVIRQESEQRQTRIDQFETQLVDLRNELSAFGSTKKELVSITNQLTVVSGQRDSLITQRSKLVGFVKELKRDVSSHRSETQRANEKLSAKSREHANMTTVMHGELETRNAAFRSLESLLAAKVRQHKNVVGDIAKMTEQSANQKAKIRELHSELTEAKKLGPVTEQLQSRIADLTAHLKRLRDELEDSLDMNAKAQERIRGVEDQLHEHVAKIRELRRERGSISEIPGSMERDDSGNTDRRAA